MQQMLDDTLSTMERVNSAALEKTKDLQKTVDELHKRLFHKRLVEINGSTVVLSTPDFVLVQENTREYKTYQTCPISTYWKVVDLLGLREYPDVQCATKYVEHHKQTDTSFTLRITPQFPTTVVGEQSFTIYVKSTTDTAELTTPPITRLQSNKRILDNLSDRFQHQSDGIN